MGKATVDRLLASGARGVVSLDVKHDSSQGQQPEPRLICINGSVTSEEDVRRALDVIKNQFNGQLDVLVNCAGIAPAGSVYDPNRDPPSHSLDLFRRVLEINTVGTFNVIRLATETMVKWAEKSPTKNDKVIIITSSIAADDGPKGRVAYVASKGALTAMTRPLALDLAPFGIRVVTIAPGGFMTPLQDQQPPEALKGYIDRTLVPKRLGQPEEFAHFVQSIIENSMINGVKLRLDGAVRD